MKPIIFASRCLGFEACRWNGAAIPDRFIEKLKPFVDYVTVCPEKEIGLGVPREPIRIVYSGGSYSLRQLNTEKDITKDMRSFVSGYLGSLGEVDGFILKDRSPSCGLKDVKVYPDTGKSPVIKKASGFFAGGVLEKFGDTAVETEARLSNYSIREYFLTRIFVSAAFRKIKGGLLMKDLVEFHASNKLLLMAYNQQEMRAMGRVAANHDKKDAAAVFGEYGKRLSKAMARRSRYTADINVMMHALGYFSEKLGREEKQYFLNTLEEYRREQVPLSVPLRLMRSYIVRFNEEYLMKQTFFEPFPAELVTVTDSGKGRD